VKKARKEELIPQHFFCGLLHKKKLFYSCVSAKELNGACMKKGEFFHTNPLSKKREQ